MDRLAIERFPEESLKRLRVLCAGLAGSLALYVLVAWVLTDRLGALLGDEPAALAALPWILGAAGVATVLAAPVVFRGILVRAVRRGGGGTGGQAADASRLAEAYTSATIVAFALRETAGVCGLVTALLTGRPLWCLILCAVAFSAMIHAWPSRSHLRRSFS